MAQAIYPPNSAMEKIARQQLLLQRPEVTKLMDLDRAMANILSRTDITADERRREYEKALLQFQSVRDNIVINGTMLHAPKDYTDEEQENIPVKVKNAGTNVDTFHSESIKQSPSRKRMRADFLTPPPNFETSAISTIDSTPIQIKKSHSEESHSDDSPSEGSIEPYNPNVTALRSYTGKQLQRLFDSSQSTPDFNPSKSKDVQNEIISTLQKNSNFKYDPRKKIWTHTLDPTGNSRRMDVTENINNILKHVTEKSSEPLDPKSQDILEHMLPYFSNQPNLYDQLNQKQSVPEEYATDFQQWNTDIRKLDKAESDEDSL